MEFLFKIVPLIESWSFYYSANPFSSKNTHRRHSSAVGLIGAETDSPKFFTNNNNVEPSARTDRT